MKYVLHGYNVVSPRLDLNGLFDGPFDLGFCMELCVKSLKKQDLLMGIELNG